MLKADVITYALALQKQLENLKEDSDYYKKIKYSTTLKLYSYNNSTDGHKENGGEKYIKAKMQATLENGVINYAVRWLCPSGVLDGSIQDIYGSFKPNEVLWLEIEDRGFNEALFRYFEIPEFIHGYIRNENYGSLYLKHRDR